MSLRIQALIPAHDCERTIATVVRGVQQLGLPALVVDDGSADRTAEAARAAGATVVAHAQNRGKGFALVSGFIWALERDVDAVLTLDGDGQHSPLDIPAFRDRAAGADLLIGRRRLDFPSLPLASFIGNSVSTFWVSLFLRRPVPDAQCGFRLYSRRLLSRVPLVGGRFETETELLLRAARLGLTVDWVPVQTIYHPAPLRRTHFRHVRDSLRVIRVVVASPLYPRQAVGA